MKRGTGVPLQIPTSGRHVGVPTIGEVFLRVPRLRGGSVLFGCEA